MLNDLELRSYWFISIKPINTFIYLCILIFINSKMILFDKGNKENYILHGRSYNFKFRLSTKSKTKNQT